MGPCENDQGNSPRDPEAAAKVWLERTTDLIERGLLSQRDFIGCLTLKSNSPDETEAELSYWLNPSLWPMLEIVQRADKRVGAERLRQERSCLYGLR